MTQQLKAMNLLATWVSQAHVDELALSEELDSITQSIEISGPYDPMKLWLINRLAAVERDLEQARADRRRWQDAAFRIVEHSLLEGDISLAGHYAELCRGCC